MNPQQTVGGPPPSVTSPWVCLATAVTFVGSLFALDRAGFSNIATFFGSMLAMVGVQTAVELLVRKVYRRPATGLVFDPAHFRRNFSPVRSLVKLAGLAITLGLLALCYLLIPMYSETFHRPAWIVLGKVWPYAVALTVPYFVLVDGLMAQPRDGYWHLAQLVFFRWRHVDWTILREHALAWIIKGFFLPLMIPYLLGAMGSFLRTPETLDFVAIVGLVSVFGLCTDLAFVVMGYTFTLRILDSHIRNSNPVFFGWVACLVCYRPFWGMVIPGYGDGANWIAWFGQTPLLLYVWGSLIILVKLGWVWSNMMFGFRFSNLTHRGIITSGPYRWSKHPSYIFKNLGWWLINVPFLSSASPMEALYHSLALLLINVIYFLRAITEEMHLSADPTYVAYAEWINDHGALRWLARLIPLLRYRPPGTRAPLDAENSETA